MDLKGFNQRIFKKSRVIIYLISLILLIVLFIMSFLVSNVVDGGIIDLDKL